MNKRFHAIVPAAGSGARFGAEIPKQYLSILGEPLIFHTLSLLCDCPRLDSVNVALSPEDEHWQQVADESGKLRVLRCGGQSRAETVRNALLALQQQGAEPDDWVLVHDAARPCLSEEVLVRLIDCLADDPVGGILAVPVADTVKQADADQRVAATIPREGLWLAQTPQMFRMGLLLEALQTFPAVTDEAGAIEAAGFAPKLVPGELANLKVTYPGDLPLAAAILRSRKEGGRS